MIRERGRDILIDVSRLIWRAWRGRAATGIDRVCLAYCERYEGRSQAVIQRRGTIRVVSPRGSDRLFRLLLQGVKVSRPRLAAALVAALATSRRVPPRAGMTYFNVGHTGLDESALPHWIAKNSVRAIYLIHDLIPITHPQYCRAGETKKHTLRMIHALGSASGLILNSRDTLSELERFAAARGCLMPPTVVAWIAGQSPTADIARTDLDRPYFVIVGTIEARKNHAMLLNVWTQLVKDMGKASPILFIIGGRGWEAGEAIAKLNDLGPLRDSVREIGTCGDAELAERIAGARALLMPSFVEGFGLPVVEAFSLGTPVIASRLAVFREIVRDIPTYLDPGDDEAWARTIAEFSDDVPERRRQLHAIDRYRAPTWEEHFAALDSWLSTAF